MRAVLAIALAVLATPAQANALLDIRDWAHCRLYPSHERCRPAAPAEPVQVPPAAPVIAPSPPPQIAPAPFVAPGRIVPPAKAKPRAKPKWKPAPHKRSALPSWCARIPKGTTMGQVEIAAPLWGVKLTPANRRQAQACLNSK
jgi:hypothetical protein